MSRSPVDPTALFLGPQGQNADSFERATLDALRDHIHWRRGFHPEDPDAVDPFRQLSAGFRETEARFFGAERRLLARLKESVPFHSPRYLGHMSSDSLIAAQVGYFAAMLYNPNNVAWEGSPVTSQLEDEVVSDLCALAGLPADGAWGTLCGGGTLANIQALWVYRNVQRRRSQGGRLGQPPVLLAPATLHYSWMKALDLLGLGHEACIRVPVDARLCMRMDALEATLQRLGNDGRCVLACVGVVGTTEGGAIDAIDRIVALRDAHARAGGERFFVHVDAAYGGYSRALLRAPDGSLRSFEALAADRLGFDRQAYDALVAIGQADGVTIDPHKLGFIPYPAGALLLRDGALRDAVAEPAPYLNADDHAHRGGFTLEGSRPGAAAAACWLAHRTVPLDRSGYGVILHESFRAARGLFELLDGRELSGHVCAVLTPPVLDVLLYAFAPRVGASLASVSATSDRLLGALGPTGHGPFALASTTLSFDGLGDAVAPFLARLGVPPGEWRAGAAVRVLRSVMMTPFVADAELKAYYRSHLLEALGRVLAA